MKFKSPNHVTNFRPGEVDIDKWLRVAEALGMRAWVSGPYIPDDGQYSYMQGFYIDKRFTNLSEFWEIIRSE